MSNTTDIVPPAMLKNECWEHKIQPMLLNFSSTIMDSMFPNTILSHAFKFVLSTCFYMLLFVLQALTVLKQYENWCHSASQAKQDSEEPNILCHPCTPSTHHQVLLLQSMPKRQKDMKGHNQIAPLLNQSACQQRVAQSQVYLAENITSIQ